MASKTTILVIDDHLRVRTLVADYLSEQGYQVLTASDGHEGLMVARRERPDLVLLDIMMPGLDGLDFLRSYRRESAAPVIMLTARIEESDKVVGLELGADDYVSKPFSMKELTARIRAVLRRSSSNGLSNEGVLQVGDLLLNRASYLVTLSGQTVNLTPSEFSILAILMAAPGRVFSRELLLERLQGNDYDGAERTIDVHIRNLRKKIEPDPARPRYIETVIGVGYRCRLEREG